MSQRFTGLWRHPDFLRLWVGETISVGGSLIGGLAMRFTAILWLDAGVAGLAVIAVAEAAPAFALGLVAGVWVDRLRRRPIMIAADLGRAVAIGSIPVAALFSVLTFAHLVAVVAAASAMTVFFNVAYQAYLPTLVSADELVEGNAKLTATASVAEVGSFSAAGWLVQLLSAPGAMAVDAASFVASAVAVARIRAVEAPATPVEERGHVFREAAEGVSAVLRHPLLRSLLVADICLQAGAAVTGVAFLLYLSEELGWEAGVLGVIFAVGGVTSLVGVWLAGQHWVDRSLGPVFLGSALTRAVGTLFMPLAYNVSVPSGALLVANQCLADPAWTLYEIREVSLRQRITPERILGRVNATMRFAGFGSMLLGLGIGAAVGELAGPRAALFAGSALVGLVAVVVLASPLGRLRGAPPPAVREVEPAAAGQ